MRPWLIAGSLLSLALAGPFAPASAQDGKVTITKSDCARLTRHNPRPDVAYQAGMDHKGRKVAPADMAGSGAAAMPNLMPEVLEIPLSITPMSGAGYASNGLGDSQSTLGSVKYDLAKGTFTLNGQPLGGTQQQELAEKCRGAGVR